jgi:hypothetical protein
MAKTKSDRLKGIPYMCQLPEKGWSPQKISDELDILMGLGDLKGKVYSIMQLSVCILSHYTGSPKMILKR